MKKTPKEPKQQCPYCVSENLDKNITWLNANCKAMNREQYMNHVVTKHNIRPGTARQQFEAKRPNCGHPQHIPGSGWSC